MDPRATSASHEQLRNMLEEQRQNFIREETTVLPPSKYLRSARCSSGDRNKARPATAGTYNNASPDAAGSRLLQHRSILPSVERTTSKSTTMFLHGEDPDPSMVDDPSVEVTKAPRPPLVVAGSPATATRRPYSQPLQLSSGVSGVIASAPLSPKPPANPPPPGGGASLSSTAARPHSASAAITQGVAHATTTTTTAAANTRGASQGKLGNISPRFSLEAPLVLQSESSTLLVTLEKAIQLVDAYRVLRVGISDEERLALGTFVASIGGVESAAQLVQALNAPHSVSAGCRAEMDLAVPAPERNLENQFETDDGGESVPRAVEASKNDLASPRFDIDSKDVQALFQISEGRKLQNTREVLAGMVRKLSGGSYNLCSSWIIIGGNDDDDDDDDDQEAGNKVGLMNEDTSGLCLPLSRCADRAVVQQLRSHFRNHYNAATNSDPLCQDTSYSACALLPSVLTEGSSKQQFVAVLRALEVQAAESNASSSSSMVALVLSRPPGVNEIDEKKKTDDASLTFAQVLLDAVAKGILAEESHLKSHNSKSRLRKLSSEFARAACRGESALVEHFLQHVLLLAQGVDLSSSSSVDSSRSVHVALYAPRFFSTAASLEDALSTSQAKDRSLIHFYLKSGCSIAGGDDDEGNDRHVSDVVLKRCILDEAIVPEHIQRAMLDGGAEQSFVVSATLSTPPEEEEEAEGQKVTTTKRAVTYIEQLVDEFSRIIAVVEVTVFLNAVGEKKNNDPTPEDEGRGVGGKKTKEVEEEEQSSGGLSASSLRWIREASSFFAQHFLGARELSRSAVEHSVTRRLLGGLGNLVHCDISDGDAARSAIVQCFAALVASHGNESGEEGLQEKVSVDCVALFTVNPDTRAFDGCYEFCADVAEDRKLSSHVSRGKFTCALEGIALGASQARHAIISLAASSSSTPSRRSSSNPLQCSDHDSVTAPIANFAPDSDGKPYQQGGFDMSSIRNMVSLPLMSNGECMAVVQIYNKWKGDAERRTPSNFSSDEISMLEAMARHAGPWLRGVFSYEFAVQAGNAAMSLAKIQARPRGATGRFDSSGNRLGSSSKKTSRSAAIGELFVDKLHIAGTIRVLAVPTEILETVTLPTFNMWTIRDNYPNAKDIVTKLALVLFEKTDLLGFFKISTDKLANFIVFIREKYRDVPYHSFFHAFDVLQTVYHFMYDGGHVAKRLTKLSQLVVLVTALCHDVDHMGLNNSFHLKSDSPLGILSSATGTQSVLEVHHCNISVEILSQAEADIFSSLAREEEAAAYRLLIDSILGTDMAKHADFVQQLKQMKPNSSSGSSSMNSGLTTSAAAAVAADDSAQLELSSAGNSASVGMDDALSKEQDRDRLIAMTLIKMADISNVTKPFEVSKRWGQAVIEEFSKQGDAEKVTGLDVQPLFDREKNRNLAKTQQGFIQFVAEPFFSLVITNLLPELQYCVDNIRSNSMVWAAQAADSS